MLDLVLPEVRAIEQSGNTAIFEFAPIDAGFARDFGNALRRVLLSSLEGAAITSVLIEGVAHEFQDIPHVKEDVTDIVQSIKQIRMRCYANRAVHIHLNVQGEGRFTARDIKIPNTVEIVNPDLHIVTLDNANAHLVMDMTVGTGRGFVAADKLDVRIAGESCPIGVIPVDAIYSPVRHVNVTTEHLPLGERGKWDKITLSVTTDGTLSPTEALRQSADILRRHYLQFARDWDMPPPVDTERAAASSVPIHPSIYGMPIQDLGLSVRAYNSLKRYGVSLVGQVLEMDKSEMLSMRNVGVGTLQDIFECLRRNRVFPK